MSCGRSRGRGSPSRHLSRPKLRRKLSRTGAARFERWQPTGKVAEGGIELQPRDTAKTVRAGAHGEPVITDRPYLELKEVVGSVLVLECDDIDEAVGIAATWPLAPGVSAVEVRPVMSRE